MPHTDLDTEQGFIDRAYVLLDKGLADAERSMGEFRTLHRSTAEAIQRALRLLTASRGTGQLVFGKMRWDGEEIYIGRRRVRNEEFDPVVVSWHAPVAQRFYEASPADPQGLELKRLFTEEDRRLVRVIDEIVGATAAAASDETGAGAAFSDALLEELDRSRDGAMRDVVATIQSEQYGIIRAPLDRVVVVQGGPGTGKTVVGLHRAAWLAFNHEELRRGGVLVVAPSTTFLTYVSGVLPSLDVSDVDQVELQRLYAGEAAAVAAEPRLTAQVKGSAAMALVLERALRQRIGWGDEDLTLGLGADRIRVPAAAVREVLEDVRTRNLSHVDGREMVRERLASLTADQHREEQRQAGRPVRATEATIRRLSAFINAVDRMWPGFTPEELLRSLYGTQAWLVQAAEGLLTADERARLYRAPAGSVSEEPWTEADLFCLDELSSLLTREVVSYAHLVVDEAQDLSPMQARALGRRCPSGSFTVLGDLAQGTSSWLRHDWQDLTQHLSSTATEVHTLSIGYRVPAPVLDLAAGQLALAGPGLQVPRSIRLGAGPPELSRVPAEDLESAVARVAAAQVDAGRSTAVLVADSVYASWFEALSAGGADPGDGRTGDFSHRVTLMPASGCKGLEFDTVLLVEPGEIADEALHPHRALYVAMTRCTQALTVVHTYPLPAGFLADADPLDEVPDSVEQAQAETSVGSTERGEQPRSRAELDDLLGRLDEQDLALVTRLVTRLLTPTDDGTTR